jgi:hypothetical protein
MFCIFYISGILHGLLPEHCPLGIHDQEDSKDGFCFSKATSLKNETEVFEHGFLIQAH